MKRPNGFSKKLNRTTIVIAAVSVVVVLLFLGSRELSAQTQMTATPAPNPQQSTMPPMPNYIDMPTSPAVPVRTRTTRSPKVQPECRNDDPVCIEQRNRLKTGRSSEVDPEFVR